MRSAKDQAAHTQLKFRQEGQAAQTELQKRDLRAALQEKEQAHFAKSKGVNFEEERKKDLQLLEAAPPEEEGRRRDLIPRAADADDADDDSGSSSDDDENDDDEEELLKAELERIRQERAVEAEKRAAEEAKRRQSEKESELRGGNPLLAQIAAGQPVDFSVKRRWDEDVVFKNQTRGEVKAPRRFINDTVRSDFHRKFLERYIK